MPIEMDITRLRERIVEVISRIDELQEVIVMDGGVPWVRIGAVKPSQARVAGLHAGASQVGPDFDDPLPDDFWAGRPSNP